MSQPRPAVAVAVVMEREAHPNRWEDWRFRVVDVVVDEGFGAEAHMLRDDGHVRSTLFPGYTVELFADEGEGYYLNLTSPEPKVFVLWRPEDGIARPDRITASYGEGTRWADSGEQVDGVALPPELMPWMAQFIDLNYKPEPPKKKRYASNKDRGRMGHV